MLSEGAQKLDIKRRKLYTLRSKVMKPGTFASFPKNVIYCFLMGSIIDKLEKWLRNLVPRPIRFQCDEEVETFHHLVMDCKKTRSEFGSFSSTTGPL